MDIEQAKKIVVLAVSQATDEKFEIQEDMPLVGSAASIDSMQLVEICLVLEDSADDHGFEFDWTSEAAMSKSRGMFRSIDALAKEFARQSEAST